MGFPLNASSHLKPPYPAPSELRIRGLRAAECIQRETRRVPSSLVFGGLLAGGIMARFARFGWGLSRRRVWRFAPRVLSIGIEIHLALLALRLLRLRSRLGSRPFCCGSNMNVVLMSRWTVEFFDERRILPTVYLVCQLKGRGRSSLFECELPFDHKTLHLELEDKNFAGVMEGHQNEFKTTKSGL